MSLMRLGLLQLCQTLRQVDCVRIHTKQPLVHLDAMSESCALIEGVEGEFLDERDTASRSHSMSHAV